MKKHWKCKKRRFVSYELAVLRANQINKENDYEVNDGKYLRAYACQECRGYHLTSQTKKEAINRKQKRFNHWLNQEVNYWESRFNIK